MKKRKNLKKPFLFFAMIALLTTLLCVATSAATYSGTCGNNVRWSLNTTSGEMTISGTGAMWNYSTDSSAPWGAYSSYIKKVTVGNDVTSIGRSAFDECTSLEKIIVLSKTADIYDDKYTISDTATIYGYAGSTAEAYAKKYDSIFVDLEAPLYVLGDVNGDDKVDSNDAIYLLRYTLQPSSYPINQSGDMNGDGKIDSNDAIYLLRHTLQPNQYPLPQSHS